MSFLLSWLMLSLGVWIAAVSLRGVHIDRFFDAIIVAAIFGVLNFFLGWFFFAVFTIGTLGLAWVLAFITRWIINAIILKITDAFTDRINIEGFRWALLAALVMSAVGTLGQFALEAAGII